jgi:hypothetical protein
VSRSKWKVPMPKVKPKSNHAHFVMAYKTECGTRMEFDGQLPWHIAQELMAMACASGRCANNPTEDAL